jgi:hypothetical protein
VPRINALYKEWKRHPPLAIMVAAYLGFKPQEESTPQELVQKLAGMPGVKWE